KIVVPPKVNVPVQSTVSFLGNPGEPIPTVAAPAPVPAPKKAENGTPASSTARTEKPEKRAVPEASAPVAAPVIQTPSSRPQTPTLFRISPRAAALAKDCVIDPTRIRATGPEGRIVEKD